MGGWESGWTERLVLYELVCGWIVNLPYLPSAISLICPSTHLFHDGAQVLLLLLLVEHRPHQRHHLLHLSAPVCYRLLMLRAVALL